MNRKQPNPPVSDHKRNMKCLQGTFAAEGMTISEKSRKNLDRIASGAISYQQMIAELRLEYARKDI